MALALEKKDQVNTALSITQHLADLWLVYSIHLFLLFICRNGQRRWPVWKRLVLSILYYLKILKIDCFFSKGKSSAIIEVLLLPAVLFGFSGLVCDFQKNQT